MTSELSSSASPLRHDFFDVPSHHGDLQGERVLVCSWVVGLQSKLKYKGGGGFGDPISPHQALEDGRLRYETRLKFCPYVLRVKILKKTQCWSWEESSCIVD